jgi:hypothetical protein
MSIKNIEEKIIEFLKSDKPGVLSIKGAWGTGKTYNWDKITKNRKEELFFNDYSYVSLFGVDTLEDFKFSILANTIDKSMVGKQLTWKDEATVSSAKAFLINGIGKFIKDISTGYDKAFINVGFKFIENMLICIDDFERSNKNLGAQNILGTISSLKEKHNCKIVLIFNNNELLDTDKNTYDLLKEKVIDYEILFSLSTEEILEITFNKELNTDTDLKDKIKEYIEQLGINNLRILKRIKEFCQTVLKALPDDSEDELIKQALHTSVLFVWSYYSKDQDTPSYDFLKNYDYYEDAFSGKEENENKKNWVNLLNKYKYRNCDELDLEIAMAVENTYFDKDKLNKLANDINLNLRNGKSRASFDSVWDKLYKSFEGDKNSFSKEMIQSFADNVEALNRSDLNPTVVLLKELDFETEANNLIDLFIEKNKGDNQVFDLNETFGSEKITDKVLIDKFNKQFKKDRVMRDLNNILIAVSLNNRISALDEEVIIKSLPNDFHSALKSPNDTKARINIKEVLRFIEMRKTDENYKNTYINFLKALQILVEENDFNEIRLKKLGINLEELKDE